MYVYVSLCSSVCIHKKKAWRCKDTISSTIVHLADSLDIDKPILANYSFSSAYIEVLGNKQYLSRLFDPRLSKAVSHKAMQEKAAAIVKSKIEQQKANEVAVTSEFVAASKRRRIRRPDSLPISAEVQIAKAAKA